MVLVIHDGLTIRKGKVLEWRLFNQHTAPMSDTTDTYDLL